ncbi:MAG: glycogen synthase GlgA [Magnetospirillum sp.]|nr:glycogen synthase GlgA [Magnetospirillum sp.]
MRVLFASSEVFPLVKTGGLADVSGALPGALREAGVDARILLPGYPAAMEKARKAKRVASLGDPLGIGAEAHLVAAELPGSRVPVWLIDCAPLYDRAGGPYQDAAGRDYEDNARRFGLLSWAAARLCTRDGPLKWRPDILHGNDWQAGLAPAYLRAWGEKATATVFTIHNMAYQGLFPKEILPELKLPWNLYRIDGLEYYDSVSFLKAGLVYSDRITTVSRRYAKEIQTAAFGCGMEGVLAHRAADLVGIVNGADYGVWNPGEDPHLSHRYAPGAYAEGKAANKAALQAELGLAPSPDAPLMVVVSRLNEQKGMDLILSDLPILLRGGAQLAVLGAGDHMLEDGFRTAAAKSPRQVAASIGYSEPLAHKLMAAGDMLLMPSRFEPCGLTQFYAYRYATVPVVHATGGLADTVVDATYDSLMTQTATGFVFEHANPGAFQWCVERALALFRNKEEWRTIQDTCVAQDFSWRRSAERYANLYNALVSEGAGENG